MVIWISGAAGSGKTTLAKALTSELLDRKQPTVWLDGDAVRKWLTPDCGFSDEDRKKHLHRVWVVATLISQCGGTVVCSFVGVAPNVVDYQIHLEGRGRDPWPGTSFPRPENPDLVLNTGEKGKKKCIQDCLDLLLFS